VGVFLAGLLLVQLLVLRQTGPAAGGAVRPALELGMIPSVARPLFTAYLVPFEITSMLLLAAIVGAVVLAKRNL
jgi:NADH-quinone oxidoreductase subunit J